MDNNHQPVSDGDSDGDESGIQLISDGEGLAVIGDPAEVERFLAEEGLPSRDLGLQRLTSVLRTGAEAARTGQEIAAESGRWVKLTKDSAQLVKKFGLRENAKTGVGTGVLKGPKGQIKGIVEFAHKPASLMTNPAVMAGVAGFMAQLAMQQTMEEITAYLAKIDAKVDDVLRAQNDTVLARMIGVGYVIEEAMTLRESRGRVDGITWSKVQNAPATIAETQAYALRQLDAVTEKLEGKSKVGDLATAAKEAESAVGEWLAVLARCFQLQDAIAVLELDRVLDASPDELDGHRLGLKAARLDRLDHIARTTERLLARMDTAVGMANAKVLLNPAKSPAVVQSGNRIVTGVHDFHGRLGIGSGPGSAEARRWAEAAAEVRDKALETGAKGVGAAKNLGSGTLNRAGSVKDKLAGGIADRARRLRGGEVRDEEVRDEEVREEEGRDGGL